MEEDKREVKIIEALKKDSRFKILEDELVSGFGDGIDYWEFTKLESANLIVFYGQNRICGSIHGREITITNKKEDVYAYSNSDYMTDKPVVHRSFTLDELMKYVNENA